MQFDSTVIIFVSVLTFEVMFNTVHCKVILWQQSPSAAGPVCLGDNVTIICNTSGNINILRWFNPQDPLKDQVIFSHLADKTSKVGIFNVNLVSSTVINTNYFLHSEASVTNITQNTSLGCADHGVTGNTTTISVIVSDTSSSPNSLTYTTSTLSSLILHWMDVNNTCVVEYVVTVNETELVTGSDTPFFSVTNLSIGSTYNFTVKSKQNGLPSNLLIVHWKVPSPIRNMTYIQTSNSSILIQWKYTEDNLRPAISSFFIMHNISSPYNESTLNHSIELSALQDCTIYTVVVRAINILGSGIPAELTVKLNADQVYLKIIRTSSSQTIIPSISLLISAPSKTTTISGQNEFTKDNHSIQSPILSSDDTLFREIPTSESAPEEFQSGVPDIILITIPILGFFLLLVLFLIVIASLMIKTKTSRKMGTRMDNQGGLFLHQTKNEIPLRVSSDEEPPPIPPYKGEDSTFVLNEEVDVWMNKEHEKVDFLPIPNSNYSVLKRDKRMVYDKQSLPLNSEYESLGRNKPLSRTGEIIYADLGKVPKSKRPTVPPTSSSTVYSTIHNENPPPVPKKMVTKEATDPEQR